MNDWLTGRSRIVGVAVAMFAAGATSALLTFNETVRFMGAVRLSLLTGSVTAVPMFLACAVLLSQSSHLFPVCLLGTLIYVLLSVAGGGITFTVLSIHKAWMA